jgi:hypothetical protein
MNTRGGAPRRLPGGWLLSIGTATLAGVLAIGLLAVLAFATPKDAGAQACSGQFAIDFAGLPAGTILGEQYAGSGVHISGAAHHSGPDALIVFDSNSTDTNLDADLRVGIGNIAIFANNLDDVKPPPSGDGLVDRPDENNYGGRAVFAFDQDVSIGSFKFVDKDHEPDDFAIAYDASGNVIKQVAISPAGNGSVQTIAINADGVRRFEVVYGDSGGFTGIEVDCGQPSPTPTPTAVETPTPTAQPETPTPAANTPSPTAAAGTPTAAPTESAAATPTAAATTFAPSNSPTVQGVAVAAESSAPRQGTVVLGAKALPAGGGSPGGGELPRWVVVLTVAIAGSIVLTRRQSR